MMKKLVSAPYLLWMAIFIIVPLIMVAYFALTDTNGAFTLDILRRCRSIQIYLFVQYGLRRSRR